MHFNDHTETHFKQCFITFLLLIRSQPASRGCAWHAAVNRKVQTLIHPHRGVPCPQGMQFKLDGSRTWEEIWENNREQTNVEWYYQGKPHTFCRVLFLISVVEQNKEWDNIEQREGQRHAWDAWPHYNSRCFWTEKQVSHRRGKGTGVVSLDGKITLYFIIVFQ